MGVYDAAYVFPSQTPISYLLFRLHRNPQVSQTVRLAEWSKA